MRRNRLEKPYMGKPLKNLSSVMVISSRSPRPSFRVVRSTPRARLLSPNPSPPRHCSHARIIFHPCRPVQDARSAPPSAVARRAILDRSARMKNAPPCETMGASRSIEGGQFSIVSVTVHLTGHDRDPLHFDCVIGARSRLTTGASADAYGQRPTNTPDTDQDFSGQDLSF